METNFQPPSTSMLGLTTNEAENEINQELNDFELDAIAGGMETITVNGPAPTWFNPDAIMKRYSFLFKL